MKSPNPIQVRARRSRGSSLVEFALLLPILLVLVFATIDLGRAIQLYNILVNMSREGANLAARTDSSPSFIIDALNGTASAIDMPQNGMIYLTRLVGHQVDSKCLTDCTIEVQVKEHTRASAGAFDLNSQVYSCSSWTSAGRCNLPHQLPTVAWPMPLRDGEEVRAVEAIYDYVPVTGLGLTSGRVLYARTIL